MATVEQSVRTGPATGPVPLLGRKSAARKKLVGRIGPWQLIRTLGEGALTRVYLARPADGEESTNTATYAVKSLRKEWWSEPRAIEAQRREAWVGQRVSHPNLLPVLSAGVSAPPFYLVMPRLEGETAAQMLAAGRKPTLPAALWIVRQAAEALTALHDATGMVHCDIKPANLMVGPDGHTTLLDMGFCQTPKEARCWADRPVVGTLHYLAPERLTSATTTDIRSDLYSLGCTLYELITGRPPFDSTSPAQLITQHREAKPTCLREAATGTPKGVASLVHRLLSKDPMRRPATPQEITDELVRLEIDCFGLR